MRHNHSVIGTFDRIASALSYITAGWVGMIILIVMYFGKKNVSKFLRFNIFQSIFISLLFFALSGILGFILQILSYIPFINYLVASIAFMFSRPFIGGYSIIQALMTGIIIYTVTSSLLGRLPRIWWVSKIIDYSAR